MRLKWLIRSMVFAVWLVLAFALVLAACGGKKRQRAALPSLEPARGAPAQPVESTLDEALAQLDALETPAGVDPALFTRLKDALREALVSRGQGKFVSTPPGEASRVTDLDLIDNWDGTYSLTWRYRNRGDYNQDGIVNISDVTPIAMHFGETVPPEGENTLTGVIDGSGNGFVDISDVTPIAMGFLNEVAGYRIEGAPSLLEPWNWVGTIDFAQALGSGRKYFDFRLQGLDWQTYHVVPYDAAMVDGTASVDTLSSHSIEVSGTVEWDTGGPVAGAWVTARTSDGSSLGEMEADANGEFLIELAPVAFNVKVAVEASATEETTDLVITGFKTTEQVETGGAIDGVLVVLPNPAGTEMAVSGDHAESASGDIIVEGLPGEVAQVFGRSYDPDASPEAFPGEFADENQAALNSSVFLWISGKDTGGGQVDQLSAPATMKLEVAYSQWADLEDIIAGNERIDVPIYDFDYERQVWAVANDGWLVDETGYPFPEEMQEEITSGAYGGSVYAQFEISHFSFHNVDYPYIGPWTLSRLPAKQRRTKLIYRAFKLAQRIAASQKGHDAYSKVNNPGADLNIELADGKGPEALSTTLVNANGEYRGENKADAEHVDKTQVHLHSGMWDWYTDTTSAAQNDRTVVLMASTLLHETAHWKDDVKKTGADTDGEEGKVLEQDLFGGDISMDYATGELYIQEMDALGNPQPDSRPTLVTDAQVSAWLNNETWPKAGSAFAGRDVSQEPWVSLEISTDKSLYYLGEPIPLTVEFANLSSGDIYIYDQLVLNDTPVTIEVLDSSQQPVAFLGPEIHVNMLPGDFAQVAPGSTLQLQGDLLLDPVTLEQQFDLWQQGDYTVKAYYGASAAVSNTLHITIGPGGRVAGTAYDADTLEPVGGALIKVTAGSRIIATATTQPDGTYLTGELPVGTVSVAAWAAGYYVTRAVGVESTGGVTTSGVDFALPPTDGREWYMFGREETHQRRSPVAGPQTPSLRWTYELGGGIYESSPAIGLDGTVYVGCQDYKLYAIYPSGTLRWASPLGGAVASSPTVGPDGTIYVGCQDYSLYAVNPDGSIAWSYPTGAQVNSCPAVGGDGSVCFGSRDNNIYALYPDGNLYWSYASWATTGNGVASSPAIAADGTIYIGADDHFLYALNPDGSLKWEYESGDCIYSSPAIADDGVTIYFGTWNWTGDNRVYAVRDDNTVGTLQWTYQTGSTVDASPAVGADGTIYVGSDDTYLYALNPDGSLKWTYPTGGIVRSSAAVGGDGTIYFGSNDHYLYALNPDGSLLWSYQTGGAIERTGPIIAGDGALYVGSDDGRLYKFRDY